ncbi:ribonuclease catalytic domain-containing protein [Amphibiibacter pelophylacis]|uniref:RNB domain-containing ribonuclease n=1 Tax=Amphibiibacter pelophylacis TaxID=1799477 RepID=A0ACC6P396_9BURK
MTANHILFEDGGKAGVATVLQDNDSTVQAELDSGKRLKIKTAQIVLRFAAPAPAQMLAQAQDMAGGIELDLAWEFAPEADFRAEDLARDYFSDKATPVQIAACWLALFGAPHYFRRVGKGVFRKASAETLQAALAGIERKRQQTEQVAAWAAELQQGQCPEAIARQIYRLLFRPDKNSLEYKALAQAVLASKRPPLELLQSTGAIRDAYAFHWQRFLFDTFPKGTGFALEDLDEAALKAWSAVQADLPLAPVQAFSIDDSATTEIDDALSVQGLGSGRVVLGIHIAAPALALLPDSVLDAQTRQRLSTVYMPGWKITMLPDALVQRFTLAEGRDCPALSLYVTLDEATLDVLSSETRIERVPIAANLRHDQLEDTVTEAALEAPAPGAFPFAAELAWCWRLARHLKAQREQVRGKPETFNRPDYSFRLEPAPTEPPTGSEIVHISQRRRGSPLDLIVAEAMILANSTWGGWLAQLGVPGIYRSQAALAPGIKVRMGTRALPHAGMGVAQYSWATSPLRRYVDLVNQWQLLACVRHGTAAALSAPFRPKDSALLAVISSFDEAYTAYNGFQSQIERYWALQWLRQNGVSELTATVLNEGLVRATDLPLVLALPGHGQPRGALLRVQVLDVSLMTLEASLRLIERVNEADAQGTEDAAGEGDEEGDDDAAAATGVSIALDLSGAEVADGAEGAEAKASGEGPTPAPQG